ncbi:MAG: T9SS type A sorting domain-containing protein, partial [Syntrophothermus sp.]
SPYGVSGDPVILAGADGKFFYFHLVNNLSRVVCHKRNSIGEAWTQETFTGVNGTKQNDKDWGAITLKNNYLYLTWAQFDKHGSSNPLDSSVIQLSRSTDAGASWSLPVNISNRKANAMAGNYSNHAPMPAVGPGSEVYVTWMGPEGLMFDRSTDDGLTWLNKDINVTPYHIDWLTFNVPGVQRTPGFPVIACDLSGGRFNGNIYISWADQRSGSGNTDVWMCRSADGGLNWSAAIRVNQMDENQGTHQFFPWLTIDQVTGFLYIVYYDRSGYKDNRTDVTMASSQDGGTTFSYTRISATPFISTQADFIGDYIGISAYNKMIRPVWTRVDNGSHSLWTAIIGQLPDTGGENGKTVPSEFRIVSVYPNPFNSSAKIQYTLPEDGFVSLKIYDPLGKEILTLVNGFLAAGSYETDWKAEDAVSGAYLIRLQSGSLSRSQKAVLLK